MEPISIAKDFKQLREELLTELHKAAGSFCRIGFLLKQARDTDILKETAYTGVYDFALIEFGLDKTQVSRFININNRFSINGNSEQLLPQYAEYGVAKLSLMLTLPDELNEELSPEYSKSDIQAIKEEYDAEQKITPLEVMAEPPADQPETEGDEFLALVVKELNDEHPDPVTSFHFETRPCAANLGLGDNMDKPETAEADIKECYMPDGESASYNIRISGQGRFMVSMKEDGITIVNVRSLDKTPVGWLEFTEAVLEDESRREFTKPAETKPKKEKVHQSSALEKKKKEAQKKYQQEIDAQKQENTEIERVEGEVIDAPETQETKQPEDVEQCHDNAAQEAPEAAGADDTAQTTVSKGSAEAAGDEVPYPDGENPEITRVFPDDHLPEEDMLINRLKTCVSMSEGHRIWELVDQMDSLHGYRYNLDMVCEWIADLNNLTKKLYAKLASRGQ